MSSLLFHFRTANPGEHALVIAESFEDACAALNKERGESDYRDCVINNMINQEDGYECVFYEPGAVAWAQID